MLLFFAFFAALAGADGETDAAGAAAVLIFLHWLWHSCSAHCRRQHKE